MSAPEVLRITAALEQAGIAYMLTGSFASAHFGLPRSTQDIDFVIETNREQLRTFMAKMSSGKLAGLGGDPFQSFARCSCENIAGDCLARFQQTRA